MEIIGDLINDIQSRYSKGVRASSSRLSNRMVYHNMKAVRSKLVNEKANKNQTFSDSFYQLLPGVEMIATTSSMLSTVQIGSIMRISKYKLPPFVYSMDLPIIASVSNIENSKVYNRVTWQTIKNSEGRKFTGKEPNYFTLENNILINSITIPKVISVRAIFDEPIAAQLYPIYEGDCTTSNCISYLTLGFAVDKDMANTIVEIVSENLIKVYGQRTEDRIQDAVDNTK